MPFFLAYGGCCSRGKTRSFEIKLSVSIIDQRSPPIYRLSVNLPRESGQFSRLNSSSPLSSSLQSGCVYIRYSRVAFHVVHSVFFWIFSGVGKIKTTQYLAKKDSYIQRCHPVYSKESIPNFLSDRLLVLIDRCFDDNPLYGRNLLSTEAILFLC